MRKNTIQLSIDPEFESMIPPLSDEEFRQLEQNIVDAGEVRDAIITWNGVILDGHNRWKVIQKHPEVNYRTEEALVFSRDEAKAWMIRNQLGRRNLTPFARTELALKLKPLIAEKAKETQGTRNDILENSTKSQTSANTRAEIAKIANVSDNTVARVEKIIRSVPEETKQKLRKGDVSINAAYKRLPVSDILAGRSPASNRGGWTKKDRANRDETERIIEELRNQNASSVYTVDMLVEDIKLNADAWVGIVKNLLAGKSTLLTAENKPRVAEAIQTYIIQKFCEVKELVGDEDNQNEKNTVEYHSNAAAVERLIGSISRCRRDSVKFLEKEFARERDAYQFAGDRKKIASAIDDMYASIKRIMDNAIKAQDKSTSKLNQ